MARFTDYVVCQCGMSYDLTRVTVTGRYTDCSTWRAPCCNMPMDDRDEGRRYERVARQPTGRMLFLAEDAGWLPRYPPGHEPSDLTIFDPATLPPGPWERVTDDG